MSPPDSTADCILRKTFDMAVPPASTFMPVEAIADAKPIVACSVSPTWFAAPARRWLSSMICDSVDAPLLPRSTRVAPRRPTICGDEPIMFMNCAIEVAAASALRLVDSPSITIVRVKLDTLSVATPSWPAASATAAISVWLVAIVFAIPRSSPSSCAICSGVPSTVFLTPANADCQSMAAFTLAPTPARIAAPATVAAFPTVLYAFSCLSTEASMASVDAFARCMPASKPVEIRDRVTRTLRSDMRPPARMGG